MQKVSNHAFGVLLKQYRRQANLTQEALAERAGISARSVSDLERGLSRAPHPDTITYLAQALGLAGPARVAFVAAAHPQHATDLLPLNLPALPVTLSALLGREREEATLLHLLTREQVRLLTLTGPAGVGKTRLAMQVAQASKKIFSAGVVFLALATAHEAQQVIAALAAALGVQEGNQQQLLATLLSAIGERSLLLVLDTCEQIHGATGMVLELLTACPQLKILATSRTRWRVRGEQIFQLEPLAVPDLRQDWTPEELERSPAVALFLERVRAMQPDFQPATGQMQIIAQICARLDGLPLAIELAATRFPLLSPQQLLKRLEGSTRPTALQVVSGHLADSPERHRSLRAALAWSYDLLAAPEQQLLRRLSIFAGGASLEALLEVCACEDQDEDHLLASLELLLMHNLVMRPQQDSLRFRMLETTREYGLEQLAAAGEEALFAERYARYLLTLLERAVCKLGGPEHTPTLECLAAERDNLRAVLRWLQAQDDLERALQLAAELDMFWLAWGEPGEGRAWLERLLSKAEGRVEVRPATRARASYSAAMLAVEQRDYARALGLSEQCGPLAPGRHTISGTSSLPASGEDRFGCASGTAPDHAGIQ
jgi:predicted ATPase/DNA-binding XRE family transcriptional regulator